MVLPAARSRPWPVFLAGVLLFLVGPGLYVLQIRWKYLGTPWYLPILATAGVALMLWSLRQRRGVVRGLILVPFLLLCGFEWYAIGVATRSPAYAGPARPGEKMPRFAATFADGTPFTEAALETGKETVLLFFRGRW